MSLLKKLNIEIYGNYLHFGYIQPISNYHAQTHEAIATIYAANWRYIKNKVKSK